MNTLVEKWSAGQTVASPDDWTFIDLEHSPYSMDRLVGALKRLGEQRSPDGRLKSIPLVRIPMEGNEVQNWPIKQVLDQGAYGVVIPHVETSEEVLKAVKAMRYPAQRGAKSAPTPAGVRGMGPTSAAAFWGIPIPDYFRRADLWPLNPDGDLVAFVMIETALAVQNIREILATPGLTGILVGPSDLSVSLGLGITPWGNDPRAGFYYPEVEEAMQSILQACKEVNKKMKRICGMSVLGHDEDEKKRRAEGWDMLLLTQPRKPAAGR